MSTGAAASVIQRAFRNFKFRKGLQKSLPVGPYRPGVAMLSRQPGFGRVGGYFGRFTGRAKELKFFDTALSFTVDNTAEIPATGQLCLIPQDDTQSGRDGNKAFLKSINIHGIMYLDPAAAAASATVVYFYVIQDTQCNGTAATVADANGGIFTNANLAIANHTIANSQRFRVLKKIVMPLVSQAGVTTAYNPTIRAFNCYLKVNIPLIYDASLTTGALTSIRSNNVFIVAGTSGLNDDAVTVNGTCRIRFSDES